MGLRWEQNSWKGWRAYDWDTNDEVFYTQIATKGTIWRVWKKETTGWRQTTWQFHNSGEAKEYCDKVYRERGRPRPVSL